MLDKLKELFKEGLQYTHTAGLLQQISNLTNIINAQYMKDGDAKNAAIDLICQMLQSHKDVPVAPTPTPEVPAAPAGECTNAVN